MLKNAPVNIVPSIAILKIRTLVHIAAAKRLELM